MLTPMLGQQGVVENNYLFQQTDATIVFLTIISLSYNVLQKKKFEEALCTDGGVEVNYVSIHVSDKS